MTEAVAYLRVSGKGQINGDGFPRQREAIRRYAKAGGIEVIEEYRDEGVSGTKDLDDRDGLSDLMARIRSNGVRVVLVERADRLARDLMVSEIILTEFRRLCVQVVAADSGTDLSVGDGDPTRKLVRQILAAISEFDRSVLVSKLRAARVRKRLATGRCEGRKPRGGKRLSYDAIAARLNGDGVPTRTGKAWIGPTVYGILKRQGVFHAQS